MTKLQQVALFFVAIWAGSTWAAGSNVYKCGSTYSQTPCEGAVAVQVDDSRSKEQKSQSDAAIVQQGKAANAMEKARLKEEAQAIAQSKPAKPVTKPAAKAPSSAKGNTDVLAPKDSKAKKKESEFFTAKEATPTKKK
jgi:hypothetical protein